MTDKPTPSDPPRKSGAPRFSSAHLLIALALLFVSSPFIQDLQHAREIERFLVAVVFLSALLAVAGRGSLVVGTLLVLAGRR